MHVDSRIFHIVNLLCVFRVISVGFGVGFFFVVLFVCFLVGL